MVALLQVAVVIPQGGVVQDGELLLQAVELVEGILLELVAQPGGGVALLVGPGNGLRDGQVADALVLGGGALRRHELHLLVLDHDVRQGAHELEDAALGRLVFPEGLVVHEEVDDLAVAGLEPAEELLGG